LPILVRSFVSYRFFIAILQIPDTEYKSTITMPSAEFQRIIRDLQVLGESCTISTSKEGIKFSVAGDIGSGSVLVKSTGGDEKGKGKVEIVMNEEVELSFALRYLNFFAKATPLSDHVILSMSPDLPMVIDFPIGEAGRLAFYLAPKIEEDGEE
jgi:proliferating cell nuclear antigen